MDRKEKEHHEPEDTPGELAFEEYLNAQGMAFEYEPPLSFTTKLVDYVVDHPIHGKIYVEVKGHYAFAVRRNGIVLPVRSIRAYSRPHRIGEEEIQRLPRSALCARPVYGGNRRESDGASRHAGWRCTETWVTIPVDLGTGVADASRIESKFLIGEGKMVQETRYKTRASSLGSHTL